MGEKIYIPPKQSAESSITGEIRMFGGVNAPDGWLFCDGSLLNIADHPNLASVLGSTYGGDGQDTFALPDFKGRSPIGVGTGITLTERSLGDKVGAESIQVGLANMPMHSHTIPITDYTFSFVEVQSGTGQSNVAVVTGSSSQSTGSAGAGLPIQSMQPSLAINFIIKT